MCTIPKVPALMVLTPCMFPMSIPLSTAMPGSNSIPPLPKHVGGEEGEAAANDPRIIVYVSTFEKVNDPVLDIASRRFGERITDAIVLIDNGITEGREDAFKKVMGLNGPSIRDRLDELFGDLGIDDGVIRGGLEDGDGEKRRVINIRGEGKIPPEYFMQYSFLQGVLPPVPFLRRVYSNELYRGLHARFIKTDLDILRGMPEKIYNYINFRRREIAMHALGWAKSMALGIEVGARTIIEAGGEKEVSSFWNDGARNFLGMMWGFMGEGDRILLGESNAASARMQSYLSALVYLNSE
jgi:hypothetical protein